MTLRRRQCLAAALTLPLARRAAAQPPPPRVASLDLLLTESLLALGIAPAAVANIPLYDRLVGDPALPSGVIELGPVQEPNLELLQSLHLDRIFAASWQQPGLERLEGIAPVAWLQTFPLDGRPLEHAASLLRQIGDLTGRRAEADLAVAGMEQRLTLAAARLAPRSSRPIVALRFMPDGRHMAVFGARGLVGAVIARLGLTNAWRGRVNAAGVASAGIEALAGLPEARIIHFDRGGETTLAMARLAESPFWQALPAVREGRVQSMPVIYPNGGVLTAARFADQLAALPAPDAAHD